MKLDIIPVDLLEQYKMRIGHSLQTSFDKLSEAQISTDSFSFYTSVSSVYSSKLEGEDIDLDSYIKHKKLGIEFLPDYTQKTDDLYNAYVFARTRALNKENVQLAHQLLSAHFVSKPMQGRIRTQNMFVATPDGKIEYVAAAPNIVEGELDTLFHDIDILLSRDLSFIDTLFFAAKIHLVFVKIHPWTDGNGRCGRLLEKWFLAQKLGEKAWFVQSEKYYYEQQQLYYQNLRLLGLEYPELDYSKALPFLLMLPDSIGSE